MSAKHSKIKAHSLAVRSGFAAFLAAALLLFVDVRLSAIPLAGFTLLCFAAPFLTRFSFYLPIISSGSSEKPAVALTFDDGPDPESTPALLDILSAHHVAVTFFVTGKKASRYPELIRQIVQGGHTVGNHTYTHDHLILFKRSKVLLGEIKATQEVLHALGIVSYVFRPPVGITNPKLGRVLQKPNLYAVNFNCRGYDYGNRRISNLSRNILRKVGPNDIVLLHDIPPAEGNKRQKWLDEIERLIDGLNRKGLVILPLAELIGKPVMTGAGSGRQPDVS